MEELVKLLQKLDASDIGLGTLLAAVLYGGYKKIWVWGYQLTDMQAQLTGTKADYELRLVQKDESIKAWQGATRDAGRMAQHGVSLAQQQIEKGPPA